MNSFSKLTVCSFRCIASALVVIAMAMHAWADEPLIDKPADGKGTQPGSVAIKLTLVPSSTEPQPEKSEATQPEKPEVVTKAKPDQESAEPDLKPAEPEEPAEPEVTAPAVNETNRAETESSVMQSSDESVSPDGHPENKLRSPARITNTDLAKQLPPRDGKSSKADANEADTRAEKEGAECPGAPGSETAPEAAQPDDVPLEQDEHPYEAPPARPTRPLAPLKRAAEVQRPTADSVLGNRIAILLHYHLNHPENLARRGPWAVMHAALPFGVEAEVVAGNRKVNALGWMCYNGVCAKQRIFQPTRTGFRTNVGAGVQGHEGQFLAILAQSRVQPDYTILIGSHRYTIMDLVRYEMATCREKSELTFKLIGLSHYLEPDQPWRDNRGRTWNLEKLVAEELAQPVLGAACGGTHRLMGLSFSLVRRQQAGLPLDGHWRRAEVFIQDFVVYTMSLQNPDGSFSTEWFEGRGNAPDIERKLQTTGHILEWLVFTLPDAELRSPQVRSSIEFLVRTLESDIDRNWPIGPRGHALRALALYYQRVYGGEPGQMQAVLTAAARSAAIR